MTEIGRGEKREKKKKKNGKKKRKRNGDEGVKVGGEKRVEEISIVNSCPILEDVAKQDVPGTQEMKKEEEKEFVKQRRRNHRPREKSTSTVCPTSPVPVPNRSNKSRSCSFSLELARPSPVCSSPVKSPPFASSSPRRSCPFRPHPHPGSGPTSVSRRFLSSSCPPSSSFSLWSSFSVQQIRLKKANVDCQVFVANMPREAQHQDIRDTFKGFGPVSDVVLFQRSFDANGNGSKKSEENFAFIIFEDPSSVEAVMEQRDKICIKGQEIQVERRRDQRSDVFDRLAARFAATYSCMTNYNPCTALDDGTFDRQEPEKWDWKRLLKSFKWKEVAARYLYRTMTMEDYFSIYVHSLASYREIGMESVKGLAEKLVILSESCPEDINEIMPPSVSGLVYNQAASHAFTHPGEETRSFDIEAILRCSPNLFEVKNGNVYYCTSVPKAVAAMRLKVMLVEGLFIYFFAKFCHSPVFGLKVGYYEKSDPIRSVLHLVTGLRDMSRALRYFFAQFPDLFVVSPGRTELSLKVDYFKKDNRNLLRTYLGGGPVDTQENDLGGSSSVPATNSEDTSVRDSDSPPSTTDSCLDDWTASYPSSVLNSGELLSLPSTIQSVVGSVLLDGDETANDQDGFYGAAVANSNFEGLGEENGLLLTNPVAIDKIFASLGHLTDDWRMNGMKQEFESRGRAILAELIKKWFGGPSDTDYDVNC